MQSRYGITAERRRCYSHVKYDCRLSRSGLTRTFTMSVNERILVKLESGHKTPFVRIKVMVDKTCAATTDDTLRYLGT